MRHYTQLTQEQRYQIHAFMKAGFTQKVIAKDMSVHPSTISREVLRNRGQRGYRPIQAHQKALMRRGCKSKNRITFATWELVDDLIKQDWSPEQISGRLLKEQGLSISHETIYLHIYQDKYQGGDLHKHLRCRKKRRKRYGKQDRRGRIPNRISIDERPSFVNRKSRVGGLGRRYHHWQWPPGRRRHSCGTQNSIYDSGQIENQTGRVGAPEH